MTVIIVGNINRGKQFENRVKQAFESLPFTSIDRLHDQTSGFLGSTNIADFIVFQQPIQLYVECKSVHGNTLRISSNDYRRAYGDISNNQMEGLIKKSYIKGVNAGIICWWVDHDITRFLPIWHIFRQYMLGKKSIRYDDKGIDIIDIPAVKKRVFFEYDMQALINELKRECE